MSRLELPNYTQFPNIIIDDMMWQLTGAQVKIILAIARKTFGWHKQTDRISNSQLTGLTGLSEAGLIKAMKGLLKMQLIIKEQTGKGKGIKTNYEINFNTKLSNTKQSKALEESNTQLSLVKEDSNTKLSLATKESIKDKKIKENRAATPLKIVEKLYFDLFVEEFKDIPNYNYPACTNLIKKYLKDYGLDKIQYLIRIWFYCKVGEWHGYDFLKLQKDWNRLLIIYKNMDLEKVNEEEYEKYAKNMEFLQEQYHKPKDVETYDEWKRENIRQKFNTIKVSP